MFQLKSTAFPDGGAIPKKYTIDGEKLSPPLGWSDAPPGTKSFALTMTDSDAPPQMFPGIFVHWMVCDIPASVTSIAEGKSPRGATVLKNTFFGFGVKDMGSGYGPPWPPDKAHRYVFTLYALRVKSLGVGADADYAAFTKCILPETIAATALVGKYGPAITPMPGR